MKKLSRITAIIILAVVLISCAAETADAPAKGRVIIEGYDGNASGILPVQTEDIAEVEDNEPPEPLDAPVTSDEEIYSNFIEEMKRYYDPSFLIEGVPDEKADYTWFASNIPLYRTLAEKLNDEIKASAQLAAMNCGLKYYIDVKGLEQTMVMSLMRNFEAEELFDLEMLPLEYQLIGDTMFVTADFRDNEKYFSAIAGEDMEKYLALRVNYGYMLTVYDLDGNPLDGTQEPQKLPEWIFPLPNFTRFRDSWFKDRDGGKRRHLGTDISAHEGTEIYSVTDAVVLYIGSGSLAGNCVYTRDSEGNEYLYCHMVKRSDFLKTGDVLKQGDIVGYVGNTGNSSANHLHLTVILKDGRHLHTYPYLKEAWDNKRIKE